METPLSESTESLANTVSDIPPIFTELFELWKYDDGYYEWKEVARWIKYVEEVEEAGNRWSKPHISTPSLKGWLELRNNLKNGLIFIDLEAKDFGHVCDVVCKELVNKNMVSEENGSKLKELWLKKHRHQFEGPRKVEGNLSRVLKDLLVQKLESSKAKSSSGSRPGSRRPSFNAEESQALTTSSGPTIMDEGKVNVALQRKIPSNAQAAVILEGVTSFLDKPVSVFIKLAKPVVLGDMPEIDIATKFIYMVTSLPGKSEVSNLELARAGKSDIDMKNHPDVGKSMATAITDKSFAKSLYNAQSATDIVDALDIYTGGLKLLPSDFDTEQNKIEPPANKAVKKLEDEMVEIDEDRRMREKSGLVRTGRFCGGLINDIKRKKPFYLSDFTNGFHSQCISSFLFLYFACLAPIVAFGGLLGKATDNRIATIESLISGLISGTLFGLFSGQPLIILGSTGPVYVFEKILYQICSDQNWDYLSLRLWIGIWVGLILILLVVLDASAAVCYITRFTEELFATLIAFIFIFNAVKNLFQVNEKHKFSPSSNDLTCECVPGKEGNYPEGIVWENVTRDSCKYYGGELVGQECDFYPNVFLMSVVLFFGTFAISFSLKNFRNTGYLPGKVRNFLSDFAVIIAILSMTTLSYFSEVHTPKLVVPDSFKPTWEGRDWLVTHALIFPDHVFANPWWVDVFLAPILAILATILIFMDQQITAVIVNRKEHKLKKGGGYHLDLMILALIIIICSVFGLPWFVAATVLSINHLQSLSKESKCSVPGEKPQFLGIREQRVTAVLIAISIGLSTMITPVLKIIPMPVLFGVFLFMGVQSLKGLQFFDRILLLFIPRKYQPDYVFLKYVPLHRIHLFTIIQLVSLIGLWLIKNNPTTSISFPVMLVVICAIRKFMECIFSRRELRVLDDLLPESSKKNRRKGFSSRISLRRGSFFNKIHRSPDWEDEEQEENEESAKKEAELERNRLIMLQTKALANELEDYSKIDIKAKTRSYSNKIQQQSKKKHSDKFLPPKFLIFVKLSHQEVFTPLSLNTRSVGGLLRLFEVKFPNHIRPRLVNNVYQKNKRNMIFLFDDDMIELIQPNQVFDIEIKEAIGEPDVFDEGSRIDLFLTEVEEGY